jgi:hypothetical protein
MSAPTLQIRAGLAAALALLVLCIAAGPAQAKVPRSFFGVEADPASTGLEPLSGSDVQRLRSARVGNLRVAFNWGLVEPTPGAARNWAYYDALVGRAARARVSLIGVLVGSPSWAAGDSAYAPVTAEARRAFALFARDVVRRYGKGGAFWRANRGIPRRPVRAFQVWNEPNYPPHWSGSAAVSARSYASLLKQVARAIRGADRGAQIATAGLLASSTRGPAGYRYLNELYGVRGIRRYFDAVAIHPYAENAAGVDGELSRVRRIMRRRGDGRTPVWITELGWGTGGGNQYFSITPAAQASRLRSTFRFVLRNRGRYRVTKLVWFSWRDRAGDSARGWEYYCGLFGVDGSPKPAWAAFRSFTRATR